MDAGGTDTFLPEAPWNACVFTHSPRSARNLDSAPRRRSTDRNVRLGVADRISEPVSSRTSRRSSSVRSCPRIGRISATGSPRSETVTVLPSRTRRMTSENRTFASYDTHHLVDRVQTAWVRGSHERLQDAHSPCEAPGHSTLRVEMGLGARCVWECGSWETTCGFPLPAFVPPSRGQASWE